MKQFEKRVAFQPAYDDEDFRKSHPSIISFGFRGPDGGVEFSLHTGWYGWQSYVKLWKTAEADQNLDMLANLMRPRAFDLSVHCRRKPAGSEHHHLHHDCSVTGGDCWCSRHNARAQEFLTILIEHGQDRLFSAMETIYRNEISSGG